MPYNGFGGGFPFSPIFFLIFLVVVVRLIVKAAGGVRRWNENESQPLKMLDATVVAKRMEVSGGEHSTETRYFATFQFAGGARRELELPGSSYGQLAEGDTGRLTLQGSDVKSFVRTLAPEPKPVVATQPARVCAYCGSALEPNSIKCNGCGWTWRPPTNSPVES